MTQDEPQPLIIDTDPGVDDVLAILLALSRPDLVRLEAITLNFGNTTLDYARDNVLRLFNVLHAHVQQEGKGQEGLKRSLSGSAYRTIFASKGAEGPIGGEQFTASYFHGRDGLSGISQLHGDPFATSKSIPSPLVEDATKPAHEVILDILRNNAPGTVRIAAVAPLTNLALAFQSDPETFCRVGGISVMGGVLDGPGNTTATSEFNTYADPFAAKVLLHDAPLHPVLQDAKRNACGYTGSLPIELLPLDITRKHTVPYARLCDDVDQRGGILRSFYKAMLSQPRRVTNSHAPPGSPFDPRLYDNFEAHDPLAVAHAMFTPSLFSRRNGSQQTEGGWKTEQVRFGIETVGELTRGYCVVDRRGLGSIKLGKIKPNPSAAKDKGKGDEEVEKPTSGQWDVVVASPGPAWFAGIFCEALSI